MGIETIIGIAVGVLSGLVLVGTLWRRMLKAMRKDVGDVVKTTVNGKLDRIEGQLTQQGGDLDHLRRWSERHDRRHADDRRQLIAAMERNDLSPPDGWAADTG